MANKVLCNRFQFHNSWSWWHCMLPSMSVFLESKVSSTCSNDLLYSIRHGVEHLVPVTWIIMVHLSSLKWAHWIVCHNGWWLVVGGASGLCQAQYYVYLEAYPEKISAVPLPDGSILLEDVVSIWHHHYHILPPEFPHLSEIQRFISPMPGGMLELVWGSPQTHKIFLVELWSPTKPKILWHCPHSGVMMWPVFTMSYVLYHSQAITAY